MPEYYGKFKDDNLLKLIFLCLVSISFILVLSLSANADATIIPVASNQRTLSISQNQNWYFIKIEQPDGNDYIGVSKDDRGVIGLGYNDEFIGKFYLVPVFRHPVNSNWYLCPYTNLQTVNNFDLGSDYMFFDAHDESLTCYQYTDLSQTGTANISTQILFKGDLSSSTVKINVNTTIYNTNPIDTGFGFIFFPEDPSQFRYVNIDGNTYDLQGVEGAVSPQKAMRFLDSSQNYLSQSFDWSDMLDTGNVFAEILTVGGQKGLMVGTYGYGASNFISIDPLINVTTNTTFPSYHLINGTNAVDDIDSYENYTEISLELSDGLATTNFSVKLGEDIYNNKLFFGYTFNEISGDVVNDFSDENNNLDLTNSPELNSYGVENTGMYCDGNNQVGTATDNPDFDIGENESFILCMSFNFTEDVGTDRTFFRKGTSQDYRLYIDSQERIHFKTGRNGGATSTSSSSYNDGIWHKACGYNNASNGENILFIDGVELDRDTGGTGAMSNSDDFSVCANSGLADDYEGNVDELCGWKTDEIFNPVDIVIKYNQTYCINETKGDAVQPFFNYTINTSQSNFLKIVGGFSDVNVFRIWSMFNYTHINTTSLITKQSSGTTSYIDINPIISDGYNQPFRVSVLNSENENIRDIYLLVQENDTEYPDISNCYWDNMNVGCGEYSTLSCNVSDDVAVDSVIDFLFAPALSLDLNATDNVADSTPLIGLDGVWAKNHSPSDFTSLLNNIGWTFSVPINLSILQVNATDLSGKTTSINYSTNEVYMQYECVICNEDWVEDIPICLINDTYLSTYTDQNACGTYDDLPAQNGTYQSCNYCLEELDQTLGTCQSNSTQTVDWTDNNYFTCCAVTGLVSDCSILYYPYNETTTQSCLFFNNTMGNITCQNEPNFNIREKEYCIAHLPNQYLNESYKCLSYVIDLSSGEIMQTNPEYRERTTTLLDLGQDPETREYFAPANALVNFYYTGKNLLPERDYVLSIECSSMQRNLKSSMSFQIAYENYEFVFFRTKWLMANAPYIIGGILLLFLILALLIWIFRGVF